MTATNHTLKIIHTVSGLPWTKDRTVADLTTQNIQKTRIFMLSVGFEPAISTSERPPDSCLRATWNEHRMLC